LKAAYRLSRPASEARHLTESEWEGLASEDFGLPEREALLSHIMACAECAVVHRSVLQLTEIEGHRTRGRSAFWASAAGLAAAAAIVAAVVVYRPVVPVTDEVTRSAGSEVIDVVAPRPGAPLAGRGFSWTAVRGADAYEVTLNGADGRLVWRFRGAETSVTVPPEVVLPSERVFFQVTAFREGIRIGSSPLLDVHVD